LASRRPLHVPFCLAAEQANRMPARHVVGKDVVREIYRTRQASGPEKCKLHQDGLQAVGTVLVKVGRGVGLPVEIAQMLDAEP
jgi:hypothetical protein